MKVLITGGSGFIGTNLMQHFIDCGDSVVNIDISSPRNEAHRQLWQEIDIRHGAAFTRAVQNFSPDIVLHLAARTDLDARSLAEYSANTEGVANLIQAIVGLPNLTRVIFVSSRLVCRIGYQPINELDYCPSTLYGQSKVIGEQIVRAASECIPCPWLIVRPTSIWGPWFDVPYKTFFISIAKGRYVHPGNRRILKSFGFIGNTIHELQQLIEAPVDSIFKKTLYLADYPPIDVAVMANAIQREIGSAPIRTFGATILWPVSWLGDCLKTLGWHNPPLTSFRLNNLLTPMVYDLAPLRTIVGDLPFTMEEGVRNTVAWLKSRGDIV